MDTDLEFLWVLEGRNFIFDVFRSNSRVANFLIGMAALKVLDASMRQKLIDLCQRLRQLFKRKEKHHKGELITQCVEQWSGDGYTRFTPERLYKACLHKLDNSESRAKVKKLKPRYSDRCGVRYFNEPADEEPTEIVKDVFLRLSRSEPLKPDGLDDTLTMFTEVSLYSPTKDAVELSALTNKWYLDWLEDNMKIMAKQKNVIQVSFQKTQCAGDDAAVVTNMVQFKSNRSFDNFFFEGKERVMAEIDSFLNNKEWYRTRGMPDALGLLCAGEPGCGKTSFVKSLLNYTDRHAIIFTLNRHAPLKEIEKIMRSDSICDMRIPHDQRIYVFEDVDCMGDMVLRREEEGGNAEEKQRPEKDDFNPTTLKLLKEGMPEAEGPSTLKDTVAGGDDQKWLASLLMMSNKYRGENTMSFLLNLLDGVVESPGRIVVMTTNHPEKLDPAVIRPGRIDVRLHFGRCSSAVMCDILQQFYPSANIPDLSQFDRLVTPARLVQLCKANKRHFEKLMEALAVDGDTVTPEVTLSVDSDTVTPDEAARNVKDEGNQIATNVATPENPEDFTNGRKPVEETRLRNSCAQCHKLANAIREFKVLLLAHKKSRS